MKHSNEMKFLRACIFLSSLLSLIACSSDDGEDIDENRNFPVDIIYYHIDPFDFDLYQVDLIRDTSNITITNLTSQFGISSAARLSRNEDLIAFGGLGQDPIFAERNLQSLDINTYDNICDETVIFSGLSTQNYVAYGAMDNDLPGIVAFSKSSGDCNKISFDSQDEFILANNITTVSDHLIIVTRVGFDPELELKVLDLASGSVRSRMAITFDDRLTLRGDEIFSFAADGTYKTYDLDLQVTGEGGFDYYNFLQSGPLFQSSWNGTQLAVFQVTPQPFVVSAVPFVVDIESGDIVLEADISFDLLNQARDLNIENFSFINNFRIDIAKKVIIMPFTTFDGDSQTQGTGFITADFNGNITSQVSLDLVARDIFIL